VRAPDASLKLHGENRGVRRIGKKLGVSYGTVQYTPIRS
jgi:hypothetical protein